MRSKKSLFGIVACCIFNSIVVEMTCETYVPSLPAIKDFFNATESGAELTVTAYLVGLALSGMIFGPISDITGRKKILIGGSVVFFISSIFSYLSYFVHTIQAMIFSNFAQGFGGGAAMIASFAGIRDKYSKEELSKILTKLNIAISIAPAFGPIIGSLIEYHYDWHYIFFFLSIVSLIAFIVNINTEETNNKKVSLNVSIPIFIINSYKGLFKNKIFVFFSIMQIMTISTIWGEVSNLPFVYIQSMHTNNIVYGFIMMIVIIMYIIGAFTNQRYVNKFGRKTMIHFGIFITLLFDITTIICHYTIGLNVVLLTVLKVPTSFALPFVTINSTTIALNAIKENRGAASAFLESTQTIGGAIYVVILGLFYNDTILPIAFGSVVIFVIILLAHFIISKKNPKVHELTTVHH